ncbi:MAG: beta-ketoacyl synthase N-terminal-like domain-containing protein [Thermodesulfobacteriota bacterium]
MSAAIRGIGAVGGFGTGIRALEQALEDPPKSQEVVWVQTKHGSWPVPALKADVSSLEAKIGRRVLRRSNHFMQVAILGSLLALEDAAAHGVKDTQPMGIVLGTGFGSTCNTFDFQELALDADVQAFSPISFMNSVHSTAAASIAAILQERSANITLSRYAMSVPLAFMTALAWLETGRFDIVLVGCADEFSKAAAYERARLVTCDPEKDRELAGIGEGSVFFLLTRAADNPSGYGFVRSSQTGMGPIELPGHTNGVIFMDYGLTKGAGLDRKTTTPGLTASYVPLYGYLPVGLGFAIAIAALSMKKNTLYASIPEGNCHTTIQTRQPLTPAQITCARTSVTGEWGQIAVHK